MGEQNQMEPYSFVQKALHWLTAAIVLMLLIVGMYMGMLEMGDTKMQLYGLHKSFGLLVLALTFVRVLVMLIKKRPKPLSEHRKWERVLAHIVQGVLYFLLFAIPFSGWVMSSSGGFPVKFFGLAVPSIVSKDALLSGSANEAHEILAYIAIALIALHVAGAFKHHFIDNDVTIKRITHKGFGIASGVALVVLVVIVYMAIALSGLMKIYEEAKVEGYNEPDVQAQDVAVVSIEATKEGEEAAQLDGNSIPTWSINTMSSTLSFEAMQYGQTFNGTFDFDGNIAFDPENLEQSVVNIEIDIASVKTGSIDRDSQAKSVDWFDVQAYPKAEFRASVFENGKEENTYIAHGSLSLHGIDFPVDMPFYLRIFDDDQGRPVAEMLAEVELSRLAFGIGQGQWANEEVVSDKVKVYIVLNASRI